MGRAVKSPSAPSYLANRTRPLVLRPRIAPGVLLSGDQLSWCCTAGICQQSGGRATDVPWASAHGTRGMSRSGQADACRRVRPSDRDRMRAARQTPGSPSAPSVCAFRRAFRRTIKSENLHSPLAGGRAAPPNRRFSPSVRRKLHFGTPFALRAPAYTPGTPSQGACSPQARNRNGPHSSAQP
jgi:hypothetical protein